MELIDLIPVLVIKAFLSAKVSFSMLDKVSVPSFVDERLSFTVTLLFAMVKV
mgnify:CR=1 FL=1